LQHITVETKIAAPPERCFLLSLSIDLHTKSTAKTHEQAIAGVTHGLIGPGETVTWRGRHFGLMLTQTTRISQYERPDHFQDVMVEGVFRRFDHDHFFTKLDETQTLMRDDLVFEAPVGPLGKLVEILVLGAYLKKFLLQRNELIRSVAESQSGEWKSYLDSEPD
jgi:ligand-binding SRPBCC domain-containing protein